MKTYVMMNGERYDNIETAAISAERQELKYAVIEVYSESGEWLRSVDISAEDGYTYVAYVIWDFTEDEKYGDWYEGCEVYYDAIEAAEEYLNGTAPSGRYSIDGILQDAGCKYDTTSRQEMNI